MARDERLLSASSDGNESKKTWRRRLMPFLAAIFLGGMIAILVLTLRKRQHADTPAKPPMPMGGTNKPSSSPAQRLVAFWQSEVKGCEKVPDGVTHVVFGFALTAGGKIDPRFQTDDINIKNCVQALHKKQILVLGSIGGSTNNDEFAKVTDAQQFAQQALQLAQQFGFDGIDIDYEAVGAQFNKNQIIEIVRATKAQLDTKQLLLAYDSYFYEADESRCMDQYSRCFPPEILPYLDWVNVMAYNVNQDPVVATTIYERAVNTTFVDWSRKLNHAFAKQTTGICIGASCAYGPGPSDQVIESWATFAKTRGGMMIYAASGEVLNDFANTRKLIKLLSTHP